MVTLYLGRNLKYLRKLQKLTQKELATTLDISYYAYNNWENDLREPDLLSLKKFSSFYNILIDELAMTEIFITDPIQIDTNKLEKIRTFKKSDIKTILQENLKKLRALKGLSRKKISEELNIPYSTYAGWENGFREPDISTLKNLASYYKISMDDLLSPEIITSEDDKFKLISRFSKNLYETYMSVPDKYKPELEEKLIAYMKEFKAQHEKRN
ncbi:helix-turn-helix domain-containing protein [Bacillus wiedmannii]|uniref:helix-turn-helix domain-containing protein n=1 Tax=Bacillus wiedmannii TaxID=1890302 RepID=UPI000BEB7577|nr:helix-turn-helix domain-containing protein [Bacillus wiedmannii]PDZ43715.1 transcriptional regulator [Bacillus wiedmannii]